MGFTPESSRGGVIRVSQWASFNHVPGGVLQSFPSNVVDAIVDPVAGLGQPQTTVTSVPDLPPANGIVVNGLFAATEFMPDSARSWRIDATLWVSSVDALDQAQLDAHLIVPPHNPSNLFKQVDWSTAVFTLLKGANLSWNGVNAVSTVASKVYVASLFVFGHWI